MSYTQSNKSIEEWAQDLLRGKTLRFNTCAFNEFKEVFEYWWPNRLQIIERDFNLVTFKAK